MQRPAVGFAVSTAEDTTIPPQRMRVLHTQKIEGVSASPGRNLRLPVSWRIWQIMTVGQRQLGGEECKKEDEEIEEGLEDEGIEGEKEEYTYFQVAFTARPGVTRHLISTLVYRPRGYLVNGIFQFHLVYYLSTILLDASCVSSQEEPSLVSSQAIYHQPSIRHIICQRKKKRQREKKKRKKVKINEEKKKKKQGECLHANFVKIEEIRINEPRKVGPHANAYFLCIPRPLAVFRGSRVCRAATLVAIPACFIDCFLRGRARDSSSLSALRFSLFLPRLECGAVGSRHRPTSLSNANAERMQAEPSRPRPAGCPSSHQLRSPFWLHDWILDSGFWTEFLRLWRGVAILPLSSWCFLAPQTFRCEVSAAVPRAGWHEK